MLKIIMPTTMLIPVIWLSKNSMTWINTLHSLLSVLISLILTTKLDIMGQNYSLNFSSDSLSSPLLIWLTTWLLPLMIITSQHHLNNESETWKKFTSPFLSSCKFF